MKPTAGTWINSIALARLVSSVLGGDLADKMSTIIELLIALAWTVYFIVEAGVKLILPSHLFHKDIAGQILLITGGGSGIGRLMCLKFAKLGAHVVTWDINSKGNEETVEMVKKQGFKATAYTVDTLSTLPVWLDKLELISWWTIVRANLLALVSTKHSGLSWLSRATPSLSRRPPSARTTSPPECSQACPARSSPSSTPSLSPARSSTPLSPTRRSSSCPGGPPTSSC